MTETALTPAPASGDALAVRACVLREPGRPPAVERVWLQAPGPGEVLVRVAAAGVCHSDVHLADGLHDSGALDGGLVRHVPGVPGGPAHAV